MVFKLRSIKYFNLIPSATWARAAHMWLDFKPTNFANFSNKMRLHSYLTYFRCAFGWILFSKVKNFAKYLPLLCFRLNFLIEYIWEKKDVSFFCILIDFSRLLFVKKKCERMLHLKYKRHLFGCELILARWLLYLWAFRFNSVEFELNSSNFFVNRHFFSHLIHSNGTLMLQTCATTFNIWQKFRHIWFYSNEEYVHFFKFLYDFSSLSFFSASKTSKQKNMNWRIKRKCLDIHLLL